MQGEAGGYLAVDSEGYTGLFPGLNYSQSLCVSLEGVPFAFRRQPITSPEPSLVF